MPSLFRLFHPGVLTPIIGRSLVRVLGGPTLGKPATAGFPLPRFLLGLAQTAGVLTEVQKHHLAYPGAHKTEVSGGPPRRGNPPSVRAQRPSGFGTPPYSHRCRGE